MSNDLLALESRMRGLIDLHRWQGNNVSILEIIGLLEIIKLDLYEELDDEDDGIDGLP